MRIIFKDQIGPCEIYRTCSCCTIHCWPCKAVPKTIRLQIASDATLHMSVRINPAPNTLKASSNPYFYDYVTFFLAAGSPAFFLSRKSPSASHRLASISCTILIHCLSAMTGAADAAITHGTVLSILFARAISMAPALHGVVQIIEGAAGLPGWTEDSSAALPCWRSDGDSFGDEKESR